MQLISISSYQEGDIVIEKTINNYETWKIFSYDHLPNQYA